ncbi:MAG: hypothetical protein JNJ60_07585 [Rhodocyclaceae bacterium]|nr:hypothetical protein [Rhodocyclaceae bacterium]
MFGHQQTSLDHARSVLRRAGTTLTDGAAGYVRATRATVREEPVKAVMLAVLAGALLGVLAGRIK